jgi:hypothetical protein
MTVAMAMIALGVVMVLAGGPSAFMLTCEHALRSGVDVLYQAWRTFIG